MNILLTNDDGYQANGINLLAKLLKKYGDRAKEFIEKHLEIITVLLFILLFLAVYFVKMI